MDAEVLHDRLAATEKAVIQIDERLDALDNTDAQAATDTRIASLEEQLTECIARLQLIETQALETTARIAEAQAEVAEAEAEAAEAEAEAVEALAEALETEEEAIAPEMEVEELEPEPEEESATDQEKSPKWWESLLALR